MTLTERLLAGIGWLIVFVAGAAFCLGRGLLIVDGQFDWAEVFVIATAMLAVCDMFRDQPWSRYASPLIMLALAAYVLTVKVSALTVIGAACLMTGAAIAWFEQRGEPEGEEEDEPMQSIVLLLREPRYLDGAILQKVASDAWGADVVLAEDEEDDEEEDEDDEEEPNDLSDSQPTIFGEEAPFMCMYWPALLVIHNTPQPYFEDPEAVMSEIHERRVAEAVRTHGAWMSVDLLTWMADGEPRLTEVDRLIGQLLAEFADDNCTAVIDLVSSQIYPFDPETIDKLRSDDPREALAERYFAPMISISPDDPEMIEAVNTAKRRWPEFVAAFEQRSLDDDEQHFGVKARFEQNDNVEYIWLSVTAIEGDMIYGELGNEPVHVTTLKIGDRIRVPVDELNDWLHINSDGEHAGGFTIDVLAQRQREREEGEG